MICDDCIYNLSTEEKFQCSILPIKKPRKAQCVVYTDAAHEMPGDMFWDQPVEDFDSWPEEDLKKVFPNKWEVVKERIEKIKQSCGNIQSKE